MKEYDHKKIEKKWQKEWEKIGIYQAKNFSKKPKFYGLIEFPYPSGAGMHVGHIRSNTAMDIISRKRRMEGYNVLYPIGWDAFGLPTENYAIKSGIHPIKVTKDNTDTFRRQLQSIGFSFDWSREINTTDPKYYKWTQWIFLQFLKKGLAYKAKMTINWCPKDKTGLANEEVVNGCCERCGTAVEKREKEQWMLAITKYADRLDKDLDEVDYLPQIKLGQRNWIGRSEGAEIGFDVVRQGNPDVQRLEANKPNFLILHGKHGSPDNYNYAWQKKELEKFGKVYLPALPNTEEPDDEEQANFVLKNVKIDENTIIISHSMGGLVALRLLEKGVKVKGLVLVSAPISGEFLDGKVRKSVSDAAKKGFNYKKIKKQAEYFSVLSDTTDNIVPQNDAKILAKNLGVQSKYVKGNKPHFCGDQEPEIIKTVLELLPDVGRLEGYRRPTSGGLSIIKVFTTRPDTLFGATYVVLAPDHELVQKLKSQIKNWNEVEKYIKKVKSKTDIERTAEDKIKTGVELKGVKAINPATKEEIPIWIADYVLASYGTGAIMAVPADDERDREFAEKFKLPIIKDYKKAGFEDFGKKVTTFKLRDWIFSRQRYWGEPIPVVHCEKCGIVPVPEKDLPVELPKVKNYQPTDSGESPLANIAQWVNVKCPKCKRKGKRETDTMPNWAGSSWYYLRYTDPKNKKEFASKKNLKYWLGKDPAVGGVNWYNGGMEHTTLHLLYSRFWHKFLFDLKLVPTSEPYQKRTSHGMILGEGGVKMSKSLGNVINPDDIIKIYGADTLRLYEMFMGPFSQSVAWSEEAIIGPRRFLERIWNLQYKIQKNKKYSEFEIEKTIKKVSSDIEEMKFNTAISTLMIFINEIGKLEFISETAYEKFLKILLPFAPHIAEELWQILGHRKSINFESWPVPDLSKIKNEEVKIVVQINGKVRTEIMIKIDENEEDIKKQVVSNEVVLRQLAGRGVTKVFYVKNRLINIVV